jgi:2,4-dienoyl-CoA reductase-like NADH-dependent reductase (Old Yellow Enzyme family)
MLRVKQSLYRKHVPMTTNLFDPIKLGAIEAPNRILMAPLTRGRSVDVHVPISALKAEYYSQRAGAGLIIAEATGISQEGLGWPAAPGVWSAEQVEAWKPVTEAVHKADGRIILQRRAAGVGIGDDGPWLCPYADRQEGLYRGARAAAR